MLSIRDTESKIALISSTIEMKTHKDVKVKNLNFTHCGNSGKNAHTAST